MASFVVMIVQRMCNIYINLSVAIVTLSLPAGNPHNLDKKPGKVTLVGPRVMATTPIQCACTSSLEQVSAYR